MNEFSRRNVMKGTAALAAGALIAGCTGTGATTASEIQTDVTAVANGFQGFITALQAAVPSIPTTVVTNATDAVNSVLTNATNIASSIAQGVAVSGVVPALQALSQGVSVLDTVLSPYYTQAPTIAQVVQAGIALAQIMLAAAGVSAATVTATAWTESSAVSFLNTHPLVK